MLPMESVRDGISKTNSAYGLTGVPETFYLDRNGRAAFHSIGAVKRNDLEVGIGAALKKSSRRRSLPSVCGRKGNRGT